MHITEITQQNDQYPALLREIDNSPQQLFVLGNLPTSPAVAIVGTRRPSRYGLEVTYKLAGELAAAGITIVSGLATGIDGMAHRGALDAGGITVAVMAGGLNSIYPPKHRELAKDILRGGGGLTTEYPIGTPAQKFRFVERNRIISGLSVATIVTESAAEGGSLITATYATNQNRQVMAVPGAITSPYSAGPNNLIRSGALAITDSSDVLAALNFITGDLAATPVKAKSPQEARILELLAGGHTTSQALIRESGYSAAEFANIISLMEITGKVRNLGAGTWAIKSRKRTVSPTA